MRIAMQADDGGGGDGGGDSIGPENEPRLEKPGNKDYTPNLNPKDFQGTLYDPSTLDKQVRELSEKVRVTIERRDYSGIDYSALGENIKNIYEYSVAIAVGAVAAVEIYGGVAIVGAGMFTAVAAPIAITLGVTGVAVVLAGGSKKDTGAISNALTLTSGIGLSAFLTSSIAGLDYSRSFDVANVAVGLSSINDAGHATSRGGTILHLETLDVEASVRNGYESLEVLIRKPGAGAAEMSLP